MNNNRDEADNYETIGAVEKDKEVEMEEPHQDYEPVDIEVRPNLTNWVKATNDASCLINPSIKFCSNVIWCIAQESLHHNCASV